LKKKHSIGILNANVIAAAKNYNLPAAVRKNDLNISQQPAEENAILRMEVELRDKHLPAKKQVKNKARDQNVSVDVSMEKVCVSFNSVIFS
jgi:ABC-type molybdate transport system ATPase subunit